MLCRNVHILLRLSSSSAICAAPLSTTVARMRRHRRLHGKQKFGMQDGNIDVHGPANPVPVPPPPPPRHPDVPFRRENIAIDTPYARRMALLSRRIHNEPQLLDDGSRKIVELLSAKPVKGDEKWSVDYYLPHPMLHNLSKLLRAYGLLSDEHADWKEEMERQREKRGKFRVLIGQGKRALKRK